MNARRLDFPSCSLSSFLFAACKHTENVTAMKGYTCKLGLPLSPQTFLVLLTPFLLSAVSWSLSLSLVSLLQMWTEARCGRRSHRGNTLPTWTDNVSCVLDPQMALDARSHRRGDALRKGVCPHTCSHTHGGTQHRTSHEAHGKSHALQLVSANTRLSSAVHSHTCSRSLLAYHKVLPSHAHCRSGLSLAWERSIARVAHMHSS